MDDTENIGNGHSSPEPFDYSFVNTTGIVAFYDDLLSSPRITKIDPAPTAEYIELLTSSIYDQAKKAGGLVPYTVIREVTENFIHAQFAEIIVSILDQGNTIRFSDQGPGITQKEKALLPGFTSAASPMKEFIRGVGSGLPIVKEYLDYSHGSISIEDNLVAGSVVTINLQTQEGQKEEKKVAPSLTPPLNNREKEFLGLFNTEGALGVTDLVRLTGTPQSSTFAVLTRLEEYGLIEKTVGQKRILTDMGFNIAETLN